MLAKRTFCSDFLFSGTSTFSCPSPKNCPSLPALTPLALAKKESLTDSGTETEAMSTLVEVAITYAWLTRRRGTPLSLFYQFPTPYNIAPEVTYLKGPVTSKRPESSCLRKTTLFPLYFPLSKIKTVPGVMDFLKTVLPLVFREAFGRGTSSDG
jgi:hypothetical protein